jgi:hypothetical protein
MKDVALSNSKTRIDRAGERLRGWLMETVNLSDRELAKEVVVVDDFRTCHADPLKRVAAGIRYYVGQHSSVVVNGGPVVAQRLKRMRTIADKLLRVPDMRRLGQSTR